MNRYQKTAEDKLKRASSCTRAWRIFHLWVVNHPRKIELLGQEWSGCDRYPAEMRDILDFLPCPAIDAMTEEERVYLASLPELIEVWRGCYEHNRHGFSWTENRTVAESFPTLSRYKHDDKSPILLHGMVSSKNILFVKLDRKEFEIVPRPGAVRGIEEREFISTAPAGSR